ncbi:MAG: hypothetical protein BroJett011_02410 [Chloroflexota bacterium]|nr:MAG: hypothetical protein BroJett011_02410 [Chloroflexota bacterium]
MEINWTFLTYLVVALFALSGFLRGWWKEAITTLFLAILVFLLRVPGVAQALISLVNGILAFIWGILPPSAQVFLTDLFQRAFGISTTGGVIQADANSGQTWLVLLIVFIVIASLIGWVTLPNRLDKPKGVGYAPTPLGSILGGLIGGFNGLLVISLVREYLDGRNLPGGGSSFPTEITTTGGGTVGVASSGVSLQATQLPSFTVLDSFLPWIVILVGLLFVLAVFRNRVQITTDKNKFRKIEYRAPLGYKKYEYAPPPPPK